MLASISRTPLKVLTPTLADRLRTFNSAARQLQADGVRILGFCPAENLLVISPDGGRRVINLGHRDGFKRHRSAGSTRYNVVFQGVVLEWREPISSARPDDWFGPTFH